VLRFMTDEEYENYWTSLGETRDAIARDISRRDGSLTMDVACGYGYYTIELSSNDPTGMVVAVDIVPSAFANMKRLQSRLGNNDNLEPLMADSSLLPIRSDVFDLATSFLGMRDIYMTRGRKGVESTIGEMIRASKKTGRIALAVTPPDLAEAMAVRVAIDVEGEVFGARSMPSTFYTELLKENGVDRCDRKSYSTGLMSTAEQTKVELEEGIEIAKEIYGRDVQDFDEVWMRYGSTIERHGYGMYSKITVISGKKAKPLPPPEA
jgi:ubiquinone/menaquinone biosynthesis C-methylase UbiE